MKKIENPNNSSEETPIVHDELTQYVDGRYLSPMEGAWRLQGYPLCGKITAVERLGIHTKDQQHIVYEENKELQALNNKETTLTAWFKLNKIDDFAKTQISEKIQGNTIWNKFKNYFTEDFKTNKENNVLPHIHLTATSGPNQCASVSDIPSDGPTGSAGHAPGSHLARLVIGWAHHQALHGGYQLTYAHAIRRAWIVGGKTRVKAQVHACIVCARSVNRPMTQIMASLPAARVTPSRPFSRCGVNYAGPFSILRSKGRGMVSTKGYVATFICFTTKAVHLELAGDLTTKSFLEALTRFIARRGRPSEIWSDNGTIFRGADAELRRLLRDAEMNWQLVAGALVDDGITWRFIPPSAPHFGGLWEAGVKSTKTHLQRVAGPKKLTYEEFSTLLAEVEMVLNCRPISPFSGDVDDLDVLTPGHFLFGGPLNTIPRPNIDEADLPRLSHWKLVRGLRDSFWARWSREYLNTLQQRTKWTRARANLSVGDLVVIIDASLLRSNGKWPLARVIDVHPGQDGRVRAAAVKTADSQYTRPIDKLIRLPIILSSRAPAAD
ncbi:uncharacterized protein LOC103318084 [Nasonia vitripennis]|uniref:Integrase catalytic domain-containing protein n=1 Tax=Nasonia vitripennis TaxID=7425 RepID=A0A7M7Q5E2_NASVI|nr:uncharacterized protein LOC103318084 [Nasonia vitripennis]